MIDTIKIKLNRMVIKDFAPLKIKKFPGDLYGAGKNLGYHLFTTESGIDHYGSSAFYNGNNYYLNINSYGSFIHLSLPKYIGGKHNYYPLSQIEAWECFNQINDDLIYRGINTDIFNGNLSRVDLFMNISTKHPFENYKPLFEKLHASRLKYTTLGTTVYFGNKVWEISIYVKKKELENNKFIIPDLSEYVMRFEIKLKSKLKCNSVLKMVTLNELLNSWNSLMPLFKKILTESIFSVYSPSQETQNSIPRYIELTENHFNTNNRHWFNKMCRELGEHRYFSFFENEDDILSFLKNFMPHYSPNRMVNNMRKSFFKVERYLNEGTTTNEMFNEIYSSITSYGVKINEKAAQT